MPPLLCPHLYRGVVGAAGEVGVKVDQAVGICRVTVLLDITIRYKHPTIAGQGQGGCKQGQYTFSWGISPFLFTASVPCSCVPDVTRRRICKKSCAVEH